MIYRTVSVALVAFALALFMNRVALAQDLPHEGTVVTAGNGKLTMTFKGDMKQHTHDVSKDAVITLNGQKAQLEDLKQGFAIKVTMDAKHVAITKIEARST
jgi:hypothetical protein